MVHTSCLLLVCGFLPLDFFFNTFNILLSAIAYPCQNNKTLVKAINLMFVPYFAAGFYLLA